MKMFLDSANLDEIRHALEVWNIDGLTTNPRHIQASGKPFLRVISEIGDLVRGTDKPVSVEVNPHLTDWEEIVAQALELAEISPNFVIKVGAGEAGCRAVRELTSRGIRTNMTLVFSVAQAWHVARAGATYVSPFVSWKEAHGDEARSFIPEVAKMLAIHQYPTLIIAAAMRHGRHLAEAALAGAHCCTAGFSVYADSFKHPYTDFGNDLFAAAWDATKTERQPDVV